MQGSRVTLSYDVPEDEPDSGPRQGIHAGELTNVAVEEPLGYKQ